MGIKEGPGYQEGNKGKGDSLDEDHREPAEYPRYHGNIWSQKDREQAEKKEEGFWIQQIDKEAFRPRSYE